MIAHNLPSQPTLFVGRDQELQAVLTMLTDPACRLVTLVGPGGIGKTRLTVEIARRLVGEGVLAEGQQPGSAILFPDGVYFIPLQALNTPDLLVSTIGNAAGFQFYQGADVKAQLLDHLQNKTAVLVLDNLEHLLSGVEIISDILAHAPGIKVLATSREALNLQEEWLYPVSGMSVPAENQIDELEQFSSVQLFVQNARRVQPGFSLDRERQQIVRICRLVGGMPLGIELAAAWVRALSCSEIADEIERGLDILETPARNVPVRHRNMRAVLDQSWHLLDEDDQRIMRRLSVFRGTFTREAAEMVAGASARHLSALMDKSWLRREPKTGRYDLHELLRQYSAELLIESGESDAARDAHSKYFANFMQARERDIKFRRQVEAMAEIEQDFANVRSAWQWAAARQNPITINLMTEALNLFGDMKARFSEAEELFRTASEHFASFSDPERHLTYNRLRARRARVIILGTLDYLSDAQDLPGEMEVIERENRVIADKAELAYTLHVQAIAVANLSEDYPRSIPYFQESLRLYEELNDPFFMAEQLVWISFGRHELGDVIADLQPALNLQRQVGDENGMSWNLIHLARYAFGMRRFEDAERYLDEAIASQRRRGDIKGLHYSTLMRGEWAFRLGDFPLARKLAEECYRIALNLNLTPYTKASLATLGLMLIVTEEDVTQGVQMCQEALETAVARNFVVGSPNLDALSALAMAGYLQDDLPALQNYYDQLVHFPYYWDEDYQLGGIAIIGILLMDKQRKLQDAVRMTACVFGGNTQPEKSVITWLDKWPLLNRLRQKWERELGQEAHAAIWEEGGKLDLRTLLNTFSPLPEKVVLLSDIETKPVVEKSPVAQADGITGRELEVLRLVADGHSNRDIARQLVLSLGTVKWYVNQIYGKLGVGSRTQAVARAREMKLLS